MKEDSDKNTEGIGQVPSGNGEAAPKNPEPPVIHVIPDEFHGAALKRKVRLSQPEKPKKTPPPKVSPEKAGPPAKASGQKPDGADRRKRGILMAIMGLFILAIIGLAAYYFLYVRKAPPAEEVPITEEPEIRCGDGRCDDGEDAVTCASDCAVKAFCGDGTCQESEGEDWRSCPGDCEVPEPVCGDGICEEAIGEGYETCPEDCEPPAPSPSPDTDSDGMTDIEETEIYGTNPYIPDTDGDSFVDLNELLNLFNPSKIQPSVLLDNPGVAEFGSQTEGYLLIYPKAWTVSEDADRKTAVFQAGSGESISVSVDENTEGLSLMDWYLSGNPSLRSSEVPVFRTKYGYDEIVSQDQMVSHVGIDGRIFTVRYELGNQLKIRYKATFKMMVNSIKPPSGL
ncbi:hypothetical protein JW899_02905 [Candidatus Uhrbacteria bacterium]|nr:hypothetical protein [Candidatus Uhrbacteria bacterium]